MKKGRISNALQRTFIFGSIAALMTGFIFNSSNLVNADGETASKVEKCALTSISLKVTMDENAKAETYTGGLKSVAVNKDSTWASYFMIRTISDTEYVTDDTCTSKTHFANDRHTVNPHEHVSGYIYLPEYTGAEVTGNAVDVQTKDGDDGAWVEWIRTDAWAADSYINSIGDIELDETVGYYDVKFQPRYGMVDGESPTAIYVRFGKEYDITYDLAGGSLTDTDAKTYVAGSETTLPIPTKLDYEFVGWTGEGITEPTMNVVIPTDAVGTRSYTANWVEKKKIYDCTITLKDGNEYTYTGAEIQPEVIVKDGETTLVEGTDYTVEYLNNVNVSAEDAADKPTVSVSGIGKYTGVSEFYFTIKPALPEVGEKQEDKSGKATYKVTKSEEGKMEVAYVAPTSKTKTISIPATVTLADGTKAKVTSIAAKAFKGNTKLQTVTIGKNVKTIGKEAFSGCKNLKKVKSAKNVTSIGKSAFANCTKLTSVAMGSKLTTIGEKAFYKCTKLTKITIPKNVKSIGKSAF